jgi:hypothetical protein
MIYKLPPIEGGDELMYNKNFDSVVNEFQSQPKSDASEDDAPAEEVSNVKQTYQSTKSTTPSV